MKNQYWILLFFGLTLQGNQAWCHDLIRCDGPVTDTTVLSSSTVFTSAQCKVGESLQLARESHEYSFGALEVDYWQGSYQRATEQTDVLRYDTYDCFGHWISSDVKTVKHDFNSVFSVENPNLQNDVATSFEAQAPMTDAEAQSAFRDAQRRCEQAL